MGMIRNPSATPELYRQLAEGELWALVPEHPEVANVAPEMKKTNSVPFIQEADEEGPLIPLFSSFQRAQEAMKQATFPPRKGSPAAMPARQMLEILGKRELRAVVNKSCRTGEVVVPPDLMRDLADGSAPHSIALHRAEVKGMGGMRILDPADFPTHLVQPMGDVLRRHRNFRAAWIFTPASATLEREPGSTYQVLILMNPRSEVIFHEFNRTAMASRRDGDDLRVALLDQKDAVGVMRLFSQAAPFHTAADYSPPRSDRDAGGKRQIDQ